MITGEMMDDDNKTPIRGTDRITITLSKKVSRRLAEMADRCRTTKAQMASTLVRVAAESELTEMFMSVMFDIEFQHMTPEERMRTVERWHSLRDR